MIKTARKEAALSLQKILDSGVFLNEVLKDARNELKDTNESETALFSRILRGTVKNLICLEYVFDALCEKQKKQKTYVKAVILTGLYQLLFMSQKTYAVINESVGLIKNSPYKAYTGFVNVILRRASENKEELLCGIPSRIRYSCPQELYQAFIKWYGKETTDGFLEFFLSEDAERLVLRRNVSIVNETVFLSELNNDGFNPEKTGITDDTYYLKNAMGLFGSKAFLKGYFYVQDLSSALSGDIVRSIIKEASLKTGVFEILDTCASPGGKTMHLSDMCLYYSGNRKDKFRILSLDVSEGKLSEINENIERAGFDIIDTAVQDGTVFNSEFENRFDLVVSDVPCSGLGIIGKKPDIKYNVTSESLQSLAELQKKILDNSVRYLKKGGCLIFSTCTLNPEENIDNVNYLLKSHPEITLSGFQNELCEKVFDEMKKTLPDYPEGTLQILPGCLKMDGFFISKFIKTV